MNNLEIEVKFFLKNPDVIYKALTNLNLQKDYEIISKTDKIFEKNLRFEDKFETFLKKNSILRLRQDSKARLTFKSDIKNNFNDFEQEFKIRKELEVEVSNFDVMLEILESLGFYKKQIYEKYRETFVLSNKTLICIDSMPFGAFLEIEGDKNNIKKTAQMLDLNWEKRILASYLKIFDLIKKAFNLNFTDITFDNFQNYKTLDFSDFLENLQNI